MPAFKVFLSHRYKSPQTNLFFFNLFTKQADLQFEVDQGVTYQPIGSSAAVQPVPTNVTRLERMVRAADAFIGIYPLSVPPTEACSQTQLLKDSCYFRLEMEIAARAGKPALIVCDERYLEVLDGPSNFFQSTFDAQEILTDQAPNADAFGETFASFARSVVAWMAYRAKRGAPKAKSEVGILLPPKRDGGSGYGAEQFAALESALKGRACRLLAWPPVLDQQFLVTVASLDWIVVDVGDDPESAAAVAFLHGQGVPALRLRQMTPDASETSALERILYAGSGVGYPKDIVRWHSTDELASAVKSRIQVIQLPPRRINTPKQAEQYFRETAKRPVNVFLSYSGKDEAVAAKISQALNQRFQKVFDYKDGHSIRPGEPWLDEIFTQLAGSAVAVPLLSADYYVSENCKHELRDIIARRDDKALHVISVKLEESLPAPPEWFKDAQFDRLFAVDRDVNALLGRIVDLVDQRLAKGNKSPE